MVKWPIFMVSLIWLASCGADESQLSVVQGESQATLDSAELLKMGGKSVEAVNGALNNIPQAALNNIRAIACTASLGHTLKDIDSLEVTVGIDPMKYFPGVGRVVGTQANLTYSFFRKPNGGLQGQAYLTPQLKVGATANPAEVRLGWSWGCQGSPAQRQGYFANVGVGGITAGFGVDAVAAFADMMVDKDSRPVSFNDIRTKYFAKAAELAEATRLFAQRGVNSSAKDRYTTRNPLYSNATSATVDAAVKQADQLRIPSGDLDATISLGSILRRHLSAADEARFRQVTTHAETFLAELAQEMSVKQGGEIGNLVKGVLKTKLAEIMTALEGEIAELGKVYLPVYAHGRSWTLDQKKLVDHTRNGLEAIRKTHGYYTMLWAEDVLTSYKLRFEGTQKLRLLVHEWMVQLERDGAIHGDMTIGGIHTGQVFHGCNYVSMTPTGLDTYKNVVLSPIKVPATVLNPFKVIATVTTLPFKTIAGFFQFKQVVSSTASKIGTRINETTVGLSHAYALPGTQWNPADSENAYVNKSAVFADKSMAMVKKFFTWSCSDSAE